MTADGDRPFIDAQTLSDTEAYVYEAVATVENAGRPVTRTEVATSAGLDEQTVDEILEAFTDVGLLRRSGTPGEARFELARRDWSAAPDTPSR